MLVDYHVHSEFSDDSWYDMEDVVKDAIKMGMKEIVFTDHVDYGIKLDWDDPRKSIVYNGEEVRNVDYEKYFKKIAYLQEKYNEQILIKKGLEFGVQTHTIDQFEKLYEKYPMDFILLSIHQVGDKEFWTGDFQKGKTESEIYKGYYQEMLDVVTEFHHYSCLAHMDLIRRYVDKEKDMFNETKKQIREILEYIIADEKGIEVNTSSVRYEVDGLTPSIKILELYYELGGRIITIGSDSHEPEHLGFGILETRQILKEIGFESYCTFENMEPIFHEI